MPPGGSPHKETTEHEANLSTVLSPEQRERLTLLIASVTAPMRKKIVDNFDASLASPNPTSSASKLPTGENNPNILDSKEEEEKARKAREKREKLLSAPKLQELRIA